MWTKYRTGKEPDMALSLFCIRGFTFILLTLHL